MRGVEDLEGSGHEPGSRERCGGPWLVNWPSGSTTGTPVEYLTSRFSRAALSSRLGLQDRFRQSTPVESDVRIQDEEE